MTDPEQATEDAPGIAPTEGSASGRLIAPTHDPDADALEVSLRPRRLREFVGQTGVKDALQIAIEAAHGRGDPLDHLLLYGPPGLGKTTLARIVAAELGVNLRPTSGPAIQRPGDLASVLSTLQEHDVLFIDEIHRLPRGVEEVLYPAMEDYALDVLIGKGPGARSVRLAVKPFTLIGATTRFALLSSPLRDRFGLVHRLDFYTAADLTTLVRRNAGTLDVGITAEGCETLAQRARGTPRIANRLLKRVRDYAEVRADGAITPAVATEALEKMKIDELGLDDQDRALLSALIERFQGGPVGLETLAASIAEEPDTVMDVYEPFLLQLGLMQRTPRGRVASVSAYEHLGLSVPAGLAAQPALFHTGRNGN